LLVRWSRTGRQTNVRVLWAVDLVGDHLSDVALCHDGALQLRQVVPVALRCLIELRLALDGAREVFDEQLLHCRLRSASVYVSHI